MPDLRLVREDGVATLTLDRPARRNALSDGLLEELAQALADIRDDHRTRAVVLTGAPPVFSAGADVGLRSGMSAEERRRAFRAAPSRFVRLFPRVAALLEALEQPTIAAINGHAVGGGWALALACDFRFAAAAAQCWIPETDLGVALHPVLATPIVRLVGAARAKEIVMSGRRYSAPEAATLGLVHRVVPGAELARAAREFADVLARKPFRPLAEVKAQINATVRAAMPEVDAMREGMLDRDEPALSDGG